MSNQVQTKDQPLNTVQRIAPVDTKGSLKAAGVTGLAVMSMSAAHAAGIDTSTVLSLITDAVAAAAVIGVAWLGFSAGISIYKKLRAAV